MSTQHIITSNSSIFLSYRVFPFDTTLNIILIDIYYTYSRTSGQRTLWEQYNFSCCILCREAVLFSEIQNVLKLDIKYISEAGLQFSSITLPVLWCLHVPGILNMNLESQSTTFTSYCSVHHLNYHDLWIILCMRTLIRQKTELHESCTSYTVAWFRRCNT